MIPKTSQGMSVERRQVDAMHLHTDVRGVVNIR